MFGIVTDLVRKSLSLLLRNIKKEVKFMKKLKFFIVIVLLAVFSLKANVFLAYVSDTSYQSNTQQKIIPIAMATDNNYVYPTLVSMTSMLENKNKDTKLEFHIMLSGKVTGENKEKFKKLIKYYPDCSVNLIDMKNIFSNAKISGYVTVPTYYRMNLPSLLPQYDKVLYIDSDTIVNKDLQELFNVNVDEYYIAGSFDLHVSKIPNYEKKLGIKNMGQYINAGVALMNTKKMREDKLEKKFSDFIPTLSKRGLGFQDQDIINAICYENIKLLSPTYNVFVNIFYVYENSMPSLLLDCCSNEEWNKLRRNDSKIMKILHWAGGTKPWNDQNVKFYSLWAKYRKVTEKIVYGEPVLKDGLYSIVSALSDQRVLDITYSSKENGGNLQLWEDNGTCAQTFRVKYVDEGYYEIESLCSGKVLDVEYSGKKTGTNVWQYERNGTDAQKWLIKKADDDNSGYYYIISKCNGLCLDVKFSETKPGTNIHVWKRNGTNAQKFRFVA